MQLILGIINEKTGTLVCVRLSVFGIECKQDQRYQRAECSALRSMHLTSIFASAKPRARALVYPRVMMEMISKFSCCGGVAGT